jgi:hypothetical protein
MRDPSSGGDAFRAQRFQEEHWKLSVVRSLLMILPRSIQSSLQTSQGLTADGKVTFDAIAVLLFSFAERVVSNFARRRMIDKAIVRIWI